jgi:hypothetical protein
VALTVALSNCYPTTKPLKLYIDSQELIYDKRMLDHILDHEVNKHSSPGWPWNIAGVSTNGEVLLRYRDTLVSLVERHLLLLHDLSYKPKEYWDNLTVEEAHEIGLVVPISLFIKDEPHKLSKIEQNRLRLISNPSLHIQIVERYLCFVQNIQEIALWNIIPSQAGFGMSTREQRQTFFDSLPHTRDNFRLYFSAIFGVDIKAYDWHKKSFMDFITFYSRVLLSQQDYDSSWSRCLRIHYLSFYYASYVTSNGLVFHIVGDPIQNSGRYNTSSDNSRSKVSLAMLSFETATDEDFEPLYQYFTLLAKFMYFKANGDDGIESRGVKSIQNYLKYGFYTHDEEFPPGTVEFCSRSWKEDGSIENIGVFKSVYKFVNSPNYRPDVYEQLLFDSEDCPLATDVLIRLKQVLIELGELNSAN